VTRSRCLSRSELKEARLQCCTLALAYLLLRLGWPTCTAGIGEPKLLDGPQGQWSRFDSLLRHWLL
jgi:hypothetical protein